MLSRVVTKVFAGFSTHAEPKAGKLFTWSTNGYCLARASRGSYNTPAEVAQLDSPVAKVSTGKRHVLIQTKNGTLYGAGQNKNGQLANNAWSSEQPEVIQYFSGLKVKSFSSGNYHNVVALEDGTVYTWGSIGPLRIPILNAFFNDGNCLGLGNVLSANKPTQIEGLSDVAQVTAGDRFTLALKNDGRVYGWGSVFGGRLLFQTGVINTPTELVEITRFLNKKHTHIVKICSAGSRTVFLCDNGKLYTFGKSEDGNTGHRPNELINEGDALDHITPVVDENFKGQVVQDFKISNDALILRTKSGGVYYSGIGLAYKPKLFPQVIRDVKNIFATESSVGVISEDNKIYYIADKILEESDQCPQTKVYVSEDQTLTGDVQQIGGKYELKFAIIA